ncbi:hypothetical protein DFH28DRAFT_925801 [Melampsora americana]|nr:hypothetical protein DFH28DRAFT_925801 [Melampsora americana]
MAGPSRRSSRNIKSRIVATEENTNKVVSSKKRKKDVPNEISRAEDQAKDDLQNVGVKVGPKTTRARLIELLERHIKKKKPRLSVNSPATIRPRRQTWGAAPPVGVVAVEENIPTNDDQVTAPEGQFEQYDENELTRMMRDVGIDTRGWEKREIVRHFILPKHQPPFAQVSVPATSKHVQGFKESQFTFSAMPNGEINYGLPTSASQNRSSSPILPSLERGTAYPRPRPTILVPQSTHSKWDKGKGRARSSDDESFIPEDENSNCDMPDDEMGGGCQDQDEGDECQGGYTRAETRNADQDFGASDRYKTLSEEVKALKHAVLLSNQKIETLTSDLKTLSDVVKSLVGQDPDDRLQPKTRGGRTAGHVRFHIEVMLGQKSPTDPLPEPPSAVEKESYRFATNLDSVKIDVDNISDLNPSHTTSSTIDPCFPYPNGPGHHNATPQQLSVIWKLMNAAGVSSFRPDFGESASARTNKWLWGLALKIFLKLAEYRIYTGISLDDSNLKYIQRIFDVHVQSLMKRYRQERWDKERKEASVIVGRRNTRMTRLRKSREKIIIEEESLWPLLPLINIACSDDETEVEPDVNTTPSKGRSIVARNSKWRSLELKEIWMRIDQRKSRVQRSIPGSSDSPGNAGRPSRPRIRRANAPESQIAAPESQPIDCYLDSYLSGLELPEKSRLQINPHPILPRIRDALDKLGW